MSVLGIIILCIAAIWIFANIVAPILSGLLEAAWNMFTGVLSLVFWGMLILILVKVCC